MGKTSRIHVSVDVSRESELPNQEAFLIAKGFVAAAVAGTLNTFDASSISAGAKVERATVEPEFEVGPGIPKMVSVIVITENGTVRDVLAYVSQSEAQSEFDRYRNGQDVALVEEFEHELDYCTIKRFATPDGYSQTLLTVPLQRPGTLESQR